MVAWLSALLLGLGLGGLSSLSAGPPEQRVIRSLRDIAPQRGDLVVLDVDDTLIQPVHPAMRGSAAWAREWWRPLLPLDYGRVMSFAWCQDGRELVERTTRQTIEEWRKRGVLTVALSARSQTLPWGADMAEALCRQLEALGIPFLKGCFQKGWLRNPGTLACTNGKSKHGGVLGTASALGLRPPSKVWVIDDKPDGEWKSWSSGDAEPEICVALYTAAQEKGTSSPRLYEVLEIGYYLKTGRWPSPGFSGAPRAAGLLARTKKMVSPFRSS